MKFKDAVKDTNKRFKDVAECIPTAYIECLLITLFIVCLPIIYPIAVINRMVKK